jgi:hypothetical protein
MIVGSTSSTTWLAEEDVVTVAILRPLIFGVMAKDQGVESEF